MQLVALAALCLVGCDSRSDVPPAPSQAAKSTQAPWPALVDEFVEDYFKAHPAFAVSQGRHEFDGQLPDWSVEGLTSEIARLKAFKVRIEALASEALNADEQFERKYLLARIDRDLFWLDTTESPYRNPGFYLGTGDGIDNLSPSVYVVRPYGTPEQRLRGFIAYAKSVARAAPDIRRNLRTPMPATYVKLGIAGFGGLAEFYRNDVKLAFANVGDAALRTELSAAIESAASAMSDLTRWLEGEEKRATGPDVLGVEKFVAMLRMTERVDTPLAQLEAAGRADLERNTLALREACKSFAPGESLQTCTERVAADKPAEGPVAAARAQLIDLKRFLIEHDIVTIPSSEEALVEESPAFNRQNGAYIDWPGPYEKSMPSIYYIAPPDPSWTKAEQAAYVPGRTVLLFTSVHEVWPGHFLQFMCANRSPSLVGRLFSGYAFVEGWAHYSEELMWEKGLGEGNPAAHIGQLTEALTRNVRYLSSIGIHTRGMTVAASEKMFREQAYQDLGTARQQAARATYDPAYLSYTLGKLMIRKLRSDWSESRGGEASWKAFHDEFLAFGGPPIPLARDAMLGTDAARKSMF